MELNKNIKILGKHKHSTASEKYIDVIFEYPSGLWEGSVPIEYRRTGTYARNEEEEINILNKTYDLLNPENYRKWLENEETFWSENKKKVTKSFFDATKDGKWKCARCELPVNPNWQKHWQNIKEMGYTTATNTKMYCDNCKKNTTHIQLLPIPRGTPTGYETFTPKLRKKIIKTLRYDVYEERINDNVLPDHKFSEIRWDEKTAEENPNDMTEEEIKAKFQLLTTQRNLQKRKYAGIVIKQIKEAIHMKFHFIIKVMKTGMKIFQKLEKKQKKGVKDVVGTILQNGKKN